MGAPSARSVRDRDAPHAFSPHPLAPDRHQDVAIRGQGRLHDAGSRLQWVLPELLAIGRRDAGRSRAAHQQDLGDAADRHQVRRAVAPAAGLGEPARLAGGDLVGGEPAGGGDDEEVVDQQGRARDAPVRNLRAGVGHGVARPYDRAAAGVERVQDPGRAQGVDATVADGRRPSRAGAALRLREPDAVLVSPHRLAGVEPVAGHGLVVAPLLLGVDEIAADREGRPARSDLAAPQLERAATWTNPSRSACRESRCRAEAREIRATPRVYSSRPMAAAGYGTSSPRPEPAVGAAGALARPGP